jgi:hypothetical protein
MESALYMPATTPFGGPSSYMYAITIPPIYSTKIL